MNFPRSSGILLHPTSLPGKYGIGDLGDEAYNFVDFLVSSGQSLWQVLPLGPTGYGDSPYACFSAFAGNPYLVSLDYLVRDGLLSQSDLNITSSFFNDDRVDFGKVIDYKSEILTKAYKNFCNLKETSVKQEFELFCEEKSLWLDNYALFQSLKDSNNGKGWNDWAKRLVLRDSVAIAEVQQQLDTTIEMHKFFQFLFFRQWKQLKKYCEKHNVKIIGDIPIFVAYDSADVWSFPELFKLDQDRVPTVVAGVPPDYFSKNGQLWGNPLYCWKKLRETKFAWWIARIKNALELVDIIRMDHFRGFASCWEVKHGEKTAVRGRWVKIPGQEFFKALKAHFQELPIMAEDLGSITPDVIALRDRFGFPGMKILQFGFGSDSLNQNLPHNYVSNCVAYTGTHDNDTVLGWFNSAVDHKSSTRVSEQIEREKQFCKRYLNSNGEEIHWDFIRSVLSSVADVAIIPLQDVLGLGTEARMNFPGSSEGNWEWRFKSQNLTIEIAEKLMELVKLYGRNSLHSV